MQATFAANLASGARVTASNVRGRDKTFDPDQLIANNAAGYWATEDNVTQAEVVFELPQAVSFNLVRVREAIALGQRVSGFAVEYWQNGAWTQFGVGTSMGSCRILRSEQPVASQRVRLKITASAACPAISSFGLFYSN